MDDITTGSKGFVQDGAAHVTTRKERRELHAEDLEKLFETLKSNSEEAGMVINDKKTQLICFSQAKNYEVNSFIRVNEEKIMGSDTIKILGFQMGRRGDMAAQTAAIKKKFAKSIWIIRHLKKLNLPPEKLTAVYMSMVRSQIEYASVVYGTLLTASQSVAIERLQSIALKTIWGWNKSYRECLEMSGLERLDDRRWKALVTFTHKTNMNERYNAAWFPLNLSLIHI